jgi:nitrate/nitrite transporter NarK
LSIKTLKWSKFIAYVSGGGLAAVFTVLAAIDQKNANIILGIGVACISLAGAVGALIPSPATSVTADATITTKGGTPTGATVVSTSSDLLPPKP